MLRVYDKQLEQNQKAEDGEVLEDPWVRWEFELKNERANIAVDFLIQRKQLGVQISQKRNDRSAPAERPFRFKRRTPAKLTKALYRLPHTASIHFNPVTVPPISNA